MFLRRLILQNVRSIERLELPFTGLEGGTRKWTLLLGENGCGKSTVLRSISLLLAGSEALPELLGNPDAWIRVGCKECEFHADLVTADGEERSVDFRLRRGLGIKDVFDQNKVALDLLDRAIAHSARNYFTIGYGVSRRLSAENSHFSANERFRHPRAQSVATMFSADATLNPLESWAMDLDYRRRDEGLKIVKSALADLLPNVAFHSIDKERKQLMFKTPDGLIPLSQLSDGYQNVAAWCGDLLYRITSIFANHKQPFHARGLLLIDELDLHLHPLWKRQLVDFLTDKLPNFQIIATTHSALTVHQAGEGELFMLRRESPQSAPALRPYEGAPRNLMLHQLLLSPIFGLTTVDSKPVEQMRKEYKLLQSKSRSKKTSSEKKRLSALRQELQDLPDWNATLPREREQVNLMQEIHQALQASSASNATAGSSRSSSRNGSASRRGKSSSKR
jgi:predicted ATPase